MKQTYDVTDPRSGHLAALNLYRHAIKPCTRQGGGGRLTWEEFNPTNRTGMRRAFHGFILKEFVAHTGHSYAEMKAWLTWKFCPDQFDADGALVSEFEKSTEAMSDTEYSVFLTEVKAFGCRELDMVFPEQVAEVPAAIQGAQP